MIRNLSFGYEAIRNGVVLTSLEATGAPSLRMESSGEIKRALSGTFRKNAIVNYLSDWIRPYIIINGVRSNLALVLATTAKEVSEGGEDKVEIEAYDRSILLKQNGIESRPHLPSGMKYLDAIKELLTQNGITEFYCDQSDFVLQTDREDWEVGTSHLDIINELLSEINYNTIWFDSDGIAVMEKRKVPDTDNIPIGYVADEMSLVRPDCTRELDAYDSYNVFIAEVNSSDYEEPLIATAVNQDPTSPLSIQSRGRRILAPVIRLNNIASQEVLQEYVDSVRNKSMQSTEVSEFDTAINPVHQTNDYLSIQHPKMNGIYQELSWEIVMDANDRMRHTAKKVIGI